jgi:hypothetical protein
MIEPSLEHHLPRDRFRPFRPRQKNEQCPGIFADDYDFVPNDIVTGGPDIQGLQVTEVMAATTNSFIMATSS